MRKEREMKSRRERGRTQGPALSSGAMCRAVDLGPEKTHRKKSSWKKRRQWSHLVLLSDPWCSKYLPREPRKLLDLSG
jgi:hypothetical protein